ncbi:type I-C CRISPR-associated protein Cas7/Csd2 [Halorhodospira halochloris]|uniref:type I-C CRISPR-associated protein Cas7/Csd2 n=1 Tax=Halorhodospira halochloris TaxID=1052 RepID=UPI001EE8F0F1|nr:type I-C CRISPR-associated protein Cas7/Csd2 [Halorhodospira halochloris]MCG5549270.1 type I-C CRISPR-associated protein Cas7/Csd2 [Halorhodospira halochloris]
MPPIENRYEFVYLFEVTNGNPNGDPDAGNMPRLDPETNQGLVTDVSLKRKVRNYVQLEKGFHPPHDIYMQEHAVLNQKHQQAYQALEIEPDSKNKALPKDAAKARELTQWMCRNFYDIRTFGAVMTTEINCGQVRGPVQMAFAQSVDPIVPLEISITRTSVTNEKDAERKDREMGRKHVVPYGLYRAHGFISAKLAEQTGFDDDDLSLFWRALIQMFEHDHSAARGEMNARKLIAFKHNSPLGSAPAHKLFDAVTVERTGAVQAPPRDFSDYVVHIDRGGIQDGVEVIEHL